MPVCKSNDLNIYYEIYGAGFPLVLSHGFTTSIDMWAQQIDEFSQRYQLILYDARGHGLSSAPSGEENYSLDVLVEDLHNLVTYLGLDKAYIGGLSMGGAITLGYAEQHPEKVAAALIFDIDGGFAPLPDAATKAALAEIKEENIRLALSRGMVDLARHRIATGQVSRPRLQNIKAQEDYLRQMSRMPVNGYIGVTRAVPWEAAWQTKEIRNVKAPCLIVIGGDDDYGMVTGGRLLHDNINGSRYVEISGCVHGTAQWRPDCFNPAVLDFLSDLEAGLPLAGEVFLE